MEDQERIKKALDLLSQVDSILCKTKKANIVNIRNLDYKLHNLKTRLNSLMDSDLTERLDRLESENDLFFNLGKAFAKDLTERDWPMTREMVIDALKYACIEPTEELISLAQPDSQQCLEEEIEWYKDARDFGQYPDY